MGRNGVIECADVNDTKADVELKTPSEKLTFRKNTEVACFVLAGRHSPVALTDSECRVRDTSQTKVAKSGIRLRGIVFDGYCSGERVFAKL